MSGELRRLDLRGRRPEDVELDDVVDHLRRGGLVAYPTETVYGLGGLLAPDAIASLQELKGREGDRPFLALVPDRESVAHLRWTPVARELADVFWPGALTLVLADPEGRYPPGVRSSAGGVAVRRCAHPLAARLVEALGEPLTSTSANSPGDPPARDGEEVLSLLRRALDAAGGDRGAAAAVWVLDVGALPPSPPSTIVDCTGATPRVLRAGATPVSRIRCLLPGIHGPE